MGVMGVLGGTGRYRQVLEKTAGTVGTLEDTTGYYREKLATRQK